MMYCEQCRELHNEKEMCPRYRKMLEKHPEWLEEATNFTVVASEHVLISTQALDGVAKTVNKIIGTSLSYEGTQQTARDIQVFSKLASDSFSRSGQFANAQNAKQTLDGATDGFKRYLQGRLNGTGQEVDWLRWRQGKLDSLINRSSLPDGNIVGYDGIRVNRFTGKTVEQITVKAAQGKSGLITNAKDVVEAIEKGTLHTKDTVYGIEGMSDALKKAFDNKIKVAESQGNYKLVKSLKEAKDNLKVIEKGTTDSVRKSTERLTDKIAKGKANTAITATEIKNAAGKGAIIGGAIAVTISGITNYVKYKNGEITEEEAFREIGEDATKGLLTGGAMGGITLYLPGFPLGTILGFAIGAYLNAACTNILDEIFGKGAYERILHSAGYVTGTAKSINEMLKQFNENIQKAKISNQKSIQSIDKSKKKIKEIDEYQDKISELLEDM